jgi:hypothetical protein
MVTETRALAALFSSLAALIGDWFVSELFVSRDALVVVVGVIAFNSFMLFFVAAFFYRLTGNRFTALCLRACAIFAFLCLLAISLRPTVNLPFAIGALGRASLVFIVFSLALITLLRLSETSINKLMTAIVFGSIAFLLAPIAVNYLTPSPREWISSASKDGKTVRRATLFLLLDEFSFKAAAPLAADIRITGLQTTYQALEPAGRDTQNVIPAMFSGYDFSNPRVCGISTICSGSSILDFSKLYTRHKDVHLVGQHFPYCDINGLKSCFQIPPLVSFGSMYRSFLEHFLKRIGIKAPSFLPRIPQPLDQHRELIEAQVRFIDQSTFWNDGGVLFAHLFIPHPPGLNGMTTLDNDYSSNIEISRKLVAKYVARLSANFGNEFSVVITSDHPLRTYWCEDRWYTANRCNVREEFKDDKVPLIVASSRTLPIVDIRNNKDVFKVLNSLVSR